jgi:hypothetical protein
MAGTRCALARTPQSHSHSPRSLLSSLTSRTTHSSTTLLAVPKSRAGQRESEKGCEGKAAASGIQATPHPPPWPGQSGRDKSKVTVHPTEPQQRAAPSRTHHAANPGPREGKLKAASTARHDTSTQAYSAAAATTPPPPLLVSSLGRLHPFPSSHWSILLLKLAARVVSQQVGERRTEQGEELRGELAA